jgi:hypothetical protein
MNDSCANCLFCEGSKLTQMVCRRFPPTVLIAPASGMVQAQPGQLAFKMLSQFPPVSENFKCGEHKPNPFMEDGSKK